MSHPDESDDARAAEGRSGGRRRRGSPPTTRPAWDAATYGRPDDMRPPPRRTPPPPDPYPADPYPSDPSPADRYPADRYPSDPYSADPLGDRYRSEPYPADPSDRYRASEPYPPSPDPYPASPDPYPSRPDPYGPRPEPYGTEPQRYGSESNPPDSYPATRSYPSYPMAPNRPETPPDTYAPDRYTSFRAEPGSDYPAEEDEPTYVASGLYRDSDNGSASTGQPVAEYPGGWEPEAEAAPPKSRAGRNLPAAIGVGLGLAIVVLGSLFLWRPAFLGVVAVAVGVGIWELVRAIRTTGINPPMLPLVAGGALMTGLAWWGQADALTFGLMVTVLAAMVWRLADGALGYGRDVTAATLVAVYVPFLGGFAALLAAPAADGDLRVLVTLAAVVLSDTGGYAAGVFFGRHPMAPSVSPKKSWEGLAGSLAATAIGSAVLLLILFDVDVWWGAVFGMAVSAAAVIGDLGESMVKRDLGVKDMSSLLPGHGGLMDRLDSIVLAAPTAYLLLLVLAPVA
jgi:phosphatidate cytidylyltransferase